MGLINYIKSSLEDNKKLVANELYVFNKLLACRGYKPLDISEYTALIDGKSSISYRKFYSHGFDDDKTDRLIHARMKDVLTFLRGPNNSESISALKLLRIQNLPDSDHVFLNQVREVLSNIFKNIAITLKDDALSFSISMDGYESVISLTTTDTEKDKSRLRIKATINFGEITCNNNLDALLVGINHINILNYKSDKCNSFCTALSPDEGLIAGFIYEVSIADHGDLKYSSDKLLNNLLEAILSCYAYFPELLSAGYEHKQPSSIDCYKGITLDQLASISENFCTKKIGYRPSNSILMPLVELISSSRLQAKPFNTEKSVGLRYEVNDIASTIIVGPDDVGFTISYRFNKPDALRVAQNLNNYLLGAGVFGRFCQENNLSGSWMASKSKDDSYSVIYRQKIWGMWNVDVVKRYLLSSMSMLDFVIASCCRDPCNQLGNDLVRTLTYCENYYGPHNYICESPRRYPGESSCSDTEKNYAEDLASQAIHSFSRARYQDALSLAIELRTYCDEKGLYLRMDYEECNYIIAVSLEKDGRLNEAIDSYSRALSSYAIPLLSG